MWLCCHCSRMVDEKYVSAMKPCQQADANNEFGTCKQGIIESTQKLKLNWLVCGPCQPKGLKPRRGLYDPEPP